MTTWLVTGAGGFLGTNAGVFLRGKAHAIGLNRTVISRSAFPQMHCLDLRATSDLVSLIRQVRPDVVLHAAAISGHEIAASDPAMAFIVNAQATRVIAQTCADVDARMIFVSTDSVYSGARGNYREDDPVEPFSVYGESKVAGELAVRGACPDHLIVRTNFFGWSETGRKSILEFFVNILRAGQKVNGYPDFVVTSIYVQTLMATLWKLTDMDIAGTFNIGSSDALSKFDFGTAVASAFGLDEALITSVESGHDGHATSRSRNLSLNTERVTNLLGGPMQSQAAGIMQAYDDESCIPAIIREH